MLSLFSEGTWLIPIYGAAFVLFFLVVMGVEWFFCWRDGRRYKRQMRAALRRRPIR